MPQGLYLRTPTKTTYHNLCPRETLPPGTESLIGLGLKFCIENPTPNQEISESNKKITRSIRLRTFFKKRPPVNPSKCIPQIHIKTNWKPPMHDEFVEHVASKFAECLDHLSASLPLTKNHNMSENQ